MAFRASRSRRRAVSPQAPRGAGPAPGFSLVEVLVAISIFSISVLGIQALFLGLVQTTTQNSHYASAVELAQAELENLRALPYSEVDSHTSMTTVAGTEYTITSVVTEGVPQPETKHIATTVSWVGRGGVSQGFTMETIYAEIRA
jgi:prepilin-type N-terminal cleavage/methylation domain-containing protein